MVYLLFGVATIAAFQTMQLSSLSVASRVLVERARITELKTAITTSLMHIFARTLVVSSEGNHEFCICICVVFTYFLSVTLTRLAALGDCNRNVVGLLILSHFARHGAKSSTRCSSAAVVLGLRRRRARAREKMLRESRRKINRNFLSLVHFHRKQR